MEAAAHWATSEQRPAKTTEIDNDEQACWGLSAEVMDEAFAWADAEPAGAQPLCTELRRGSFVVWQENWDTVCLFWSVRRCWRLRPFGGVMGFDWTQVHSRLAMRGLRGRRLATAATRLEAMEGAIMEVLSHG